MSNKSIISDTQMSQLPGALLSRMKALGHTQDEVSSITGVGQSQISRVINRRRKRLTSDMRKLCQYAELKDLSGDESIDLGALNVLLYRLTSGDPTATACVRDVLTSLAPLIERNRKALPQPHP
jgi:transcriptional regulator with XRE-family HTH domain